MSSGFFAMDQIDAHNPAMNDRHQTKPYPLRMGDGLRSKLEDQAREMGRSLNAEIVGRLEESFDSPKATLTDAQAKSLANEIMSMIEVKSREPAQVVLATDLDVPDIETLLERIDNRRAEEDLAVARLIEAAGEAAHAIYVAEGPSERYEEARNRIFRLRDLQGEIYYHKYFLEELRSPPATDDRSAAAPERKVK